MLTQSPATGLKLSVVANWLVEVVSWPDSSHQITSAVVPCTMLTRPGFESAEKSTADELSSPRVRSTASTISLSGVLVGDGSKLSFSTETLKSRGRFDLPQGYLTMRSPRAPIRGFHNPLTASGMI